MRLFLLLCIAAFNSYLRICRFFQASTLSSIGNWSDSLEGATGEPLQGVVVKTPPELLRIKSFQRRNQG